VQGFSALFLCQVAGVEKFRRQTGGQEEGDVSFMGNGRKTWLVLEDGTYFEGFSFGVEKEICGWVHSDHCVVGYQEILTDPDNRGAIVNMTYPLIGNCGVNDDDDESDGAQALALIVKEKSAVVSNWRASSSLDDFMMRRRIVGMERVDTRSLEIHLRDCGEMKGIVAPADQGLDILLKKIRDYRIPEATEQVGGLPVPESGRESFAGDDRYRVVLWDLGVKRSYIRQIEQSHCQLVKAPFSAKWDAVNALEPEGLVISNGPGDPRDFGQLVDELRKALGKLPVIGISLGCQIMALAAGGNVAAMKTGHHGANYPVRELVNGRTSITAQNHSYRITETPFADKDFRISHVNLNDGSVEGIAAENHRAVGLQFAPLPDDDGEPHDLFGRFVRLMSEGRSGNRL
jgi:carbamoyl-phosphate synthase small subunit